MSRIVKIGLFIDITTIITGIALAYIIYFGG